MLSPKFWDCIGLDLDECVVKKAAVSQFYIEVYGVNLFIKNLDSEFYKRRHIILFIKKKKKEKKKSIEIIHWVEYTHQPILFGNDNIKVKLLKKKKHIWNQIPYLYYKINLLH